MAGINEFLEKIGQDEELQQKIDAAVDSDEALRIIKEAGFDVTEDEFKSLISSDAENMEEGELSDDALDDVNGGLTISISISGSGMGSKIAAKSAKRLFGNKSGATTTQMDGSVGGGVTNALLSGGTIKKNNGTLIC